MLSTSALVLAALSAAGMVLIGVNAFRAPQAATGFGIPATPTADPVFRAWLTVKGVRDIACGLFVIVLLIGATPQLLGWFLLTAAAIPVGDALIVLRSDGSRATAYGVHGATAAALVGIAVLLLVS